MLLNNYITLNLRVCGSESVSTVVGGARSYIDGIAVGDVNSMTDATRYI